MQFIKESTEGSNIITGLDSDAIRINEDIHHGSLFVQANLVASWPIQEVSQINDDAWQKILEPSPELILLGTGERLIFPEPHQLKAIYARNIGIEVMDSEAACRTYNLLAHEGRKVTAAIILPKL